MKDDGVRSKNTSLRDKMMKRKHNTPTRLIRQSAFSQLSHERSPSGTEENAEHCEQDLTKWTEHARKQSRFEGREGKEGREKKRKK